MRKTKGNAPRPEIPGYEALTPEEMRVLTVPPRDWYAAASEAAARERSGEYDSARVYWVRAASLSVLSLDRHWCEARALWCARQLMSGGRE
ncbi:hypothetical protein DEO48_25600 [Enterobacter sp. CGMCC 5087]|uniref:ANR family transcriptional regulator n=1 Tax=Enterobacter sp. CGMCC 5087 TaxID=2183878 RepID=UPI000D67842E|nr:ANR family transcriptional regulator [Enterobacter sp. CGMCC 5087]PWI77189.1 hypothetical protein DEO48_25600 [Enterobacter sp. CGMCC 5087]